MAYPTHIQAKHESLLHQQKYTEGFYFKLMLEEQSKAWIGRRREKLSDQRNEKTMLGVEEGSFGEKQGVGLWR